MLAAFLSLDFGVAAVRFVFAGLNSALIAGWDDFEFDLLGVACDCLLLEEK